jgi:hypothetical protein
LDSASDHRCVAGGSEQIRCRQRRHCVCSSAIAVDVFSPVVSDLETLPLDAPEMKATLRRKSWLFREWDVSVPTGHFRIKYSGHGQGHVHGNSGRSGRSYGFESVQVDGVTVAKVRTVFFRARRFDFSLGGLAATVDVRVWPWLTLRAIRLEVGGEVCYTEGFQ